MQYLFLILIYAGQHVTTEAEARSRIIGTAGTDVQLQATATLPAIPATNP
jgi:hypothetical protein